MNISDFEEKFDNGEDVTEFLDVSKAKRPGFATKRVNVDIPFWMLESLDKEAHRIGTSRQALIKFWLADRLDRDAKR